MARDAPVTVDNVTPADTALFGQYPGGLLALKYLVDGSGNPANSAGTTTTTGIINMTAVPLNANRTIRVEAFGLLKLDATGVSAGSGVQAVLQIDSTTLIEEDYAVDHYSGLGATLEGRRKFSLKYIFAWGPAGNHDFHLVAGVVGSGGTAQVLGTAQPCGLFVYDDGPSMNPDV